MLGVASSTFLHMGMSLADVLGSVDIWGHSQTSTFKASRQLLPWQLQHHSCFGYHLSVLALETLLELQHETSGT